MTSPRRKAELAAECEVRDMERRAEERRRAALTMWERIEEADASADVKEILHAFAEALGLEG